jgi:hypothetical protein
LHLIAEQPSLCSIEAGVLENPGIEDAWRAFRAVHCRECRQTDFVDEPGAKKDAVSS